MLIPTVIETHQPRRARLRHLLPPARATASCSSARRVDETVANLVIAQLLHLEGEDIDRDGQPLHQLARRRHDRACSRSTTPCSSSARPSHDLRRPGRLGRRRAAGRRRAGQALRAAQRPRADPPAPRWRPGPVRRHGDRRAGDGRDAASAWSTSSPSAPASPASASWPTSTATSSCGARTPWTTGWSTRSSSTGSPAPGARLPAARGCCGQRLIAPRASGDGQTGPMDAPLRLRGHGLELAADAYGPDDGPPVLLFPGGGQTRHSWDGTARLLGDKGWHATTVDLRGHGDSDWARTATTASTPSPPTCGRPRATGGPTIGPRRWWGPRSAGSAR